MAVTAVPADGIRVTPHDRHVGLAWCEDSEPMYFEGTYRQCRVKLAHLMRQHREQEEVVTWYYRGRRIEWVWCGEWRRQNALEFADGVAWVKTA